MSCLSLEYFSPFFVDAVFFGHSISGFSAHNSASQPFAGVAGLEALGVAAEAQVVSFFVDDDGFADDVTLAGAIQRDFGVENVDFGDSVGSGLDVAQVTDVAGYGVLGAVGFLNRAKERSEKGSLAHRGPFLP
jgi:hypothetical protein